MLKKNADLIFSIVWIQGIAGIAGTLVGFVLAAQLAKLAEVRYTFMVPIMFIFILLGAFSVNRDPLDLVGRGRFRHPRLFHAPFRLSSAGDDSRFGIGRSDGKISLPLGGELRL